MFALKLKQLAAAAAVVSACSVEPATESTESSLRCDVFVCGNAPTAGDGFLFDEINLDTAGTNYAGVRVESMKLATGTRVTLGVDRHFFYAREIGGPREWRGAQLRDAIVTLKRDESAEAFEVRFEEYDLQNQHFRVGADELVPVYLLKVRRAGADQKTERFVCNNSAIPHDPDWTADAHAALVYRGDKYSPDEKRVIASDEKSKWAFLACAGSGGAKLHLHRHTLAGSYRYLGGDAPPRGPAEYQTTLDDRTTLMKAITADYCGDGTSHTIAGVPLVYAANKPWWPPRGWSPAAMVPPAVRSIDAIWTPGGARCIDDRRYDTGPIGCTLLPCGGSSGWTSSDYAITANPPPLP